MDNSSDEHGIQFDKIEEQTLLCHDPDIVPNIEDFYAALNTRIIVAIALAAVLCITTLVIFYKNLPFLLKNTPKKFLTRTILLCGIYQLVAVSSFVSILIPKSILLCDTISHLAFTICAYQLVCLFIDYAEGETNFIKQADSDAFTLKVPPCFCCCPCLRSSVITKSKFHLIRYLVMQWPFIQGIIYVTLNILFIENYKLYKTVFVYFIPFIVLSIIAGVWGLNIIVRMMAPYLPEHQIKGKYFALQLVLMMCKIQPGIGEIIISNVNFGCNYPLTPGIYKNVIVQIIILMQMVMLSIWVQRLYRKPLKRFSITSSH